MKTPRTIQTKRTRPKSGFRMLHAATRLSKKRKQRASTTAVPEDLGEVPGVGVARALVVILLLHVAAIAGIWLHNRWSEGADIKASVPALKGPLPPTRIAELRPYTVNVGDNYEKIARKHGVDREALEKVNEGKALEAGWVINLPKRRNEEISPADAMSGRVNPSVEEDPLYTQQPRPLIQTSDTHTHPGSEPGDLVEVETNKPLLIKPRGQVDDSTPPRREPGASGRRHVVRDGETLWGISQKNGVSVAALQRANPNVNVKKMKIGTSLVIPAKR
jgi:LysM repeat protein